MEILGKEYLVDIAKQIAEETHKRDDFLLYVSELLRSCNNNLAKTLGGTSFPKSWKEITEYKPETRTAAQIKNEILDGMHELGEE